MTPNGVIFLFFFLFFFHRLHDDHLHYLGQLCIISLEHNSCAEACCNLNCSTSDACWNTLKPHTTLSYTQVCSQLGNAAHLANAAVVQSCHKIVYSLSGLMSSLRTTAVHCTLLLGYDPHT